MIDRLKKTERLIRTWVILHNNPAGYTVGELADKFQVGVRTVYRDLEALQSDLKVPVYDDAKRWKLNHKEMLPPIRFTLPEALNIFLAARLMLGYSHRYDPNIDATFSKLASALPGRLGQQVQKTVDWMHNLPRDDRLLRVLAAVAEAWVSQRRLKIVYRALASENAMERVIEPYYIEPASPGHASYVIAYCHLKSAVRTFKIERIESALLTTDPYTIPPDFDANEYFGSSWGIVVEGEVKEVKLRIKDPEMMRLMNETVWHPSQVLKKQKDGSMMMTLKVTETGEFYSWILGWGDKMEVLEPPEIREDIIQTVDAMRKVYLQRR